MHRLFVALRPPAAIRARLLDLMGGVAGARWQDDDRLHITIRFIGDVDGRLAEDVAATLGSVRNPGFEIALSGLGRFDRRGQATALWAGVTPHDPLQRLHKKVDQTLVRTGLEPERRAYLPHLTLARFGRDAGLLDDFIARHGSLSSPPFAISHFILFESRLGRDGASYEPVERYALGRV